MGMYNLKDVETGLYLGSSNGLLVASVDAFNYELERAEFLKNWFYDRGRDFVLVSVVE